ncbi:MAG: fused MFS/spermidine synthase [Planctomycetales bacterium]|nr:fused MFS/spermidine synthase [Planctomycetales bacterium]
MQITKLLQFSTAVVFALTIFLGAFLLFGVQPLIGRYLLPWFGGSPEVWTTCMLFFQVFLLAGYAYAHLLMRIKQPRRQMALHIGLLAAALLFLPILPKDAFKPTSNGNPILQILLICTVTVGLPYLLLAATSPLIQAWFSRAFPSRNPYRLYALSNTGSLLALTSFPFFFEPFFTRAQTVYAWSWAFAAFAGLCATAALLAHVPAALNGAHSAPDSGSDSTSSSARRRWLWLALPAAASVELLAVTNKITQDIAAIPFLWVLPLTVYLLSFIICFEHQRWYKRSVFMPLFILGMVGVMYVHLYEEDLGAYQLIGLYVFMLFSCCMVCHGELYRLRPASSGLTGYYLIIAAGGALGGFFVAVVCPLIFNVYIELYLGLLACACFLLLTDGQGNLSKRNTSAASRRPYWIAALLAAGIGGIFFMGRRTIDNQRSVANVRNFFGVLGIWEEAWNDPRHHKLLMQHGTTFHGLQFQSPEKKDLPTAYYSPDSGIGLTLRNLPKQDNRRIGIVGLGVGTIAIYGHPTDTIRFYEINPEVEQMARNYFTYLEDSPSAMEIVLGDARLSMEYESPQAYDVLAVDAFSSDAVPVHLLTAEAMEIYLAHLAPDGVLAFHVSTMHLDIHSVIWKLADHFGLHTAWIEGYENPDAGVLASDWILLARDDHFLKTEAILQNTTPSVHRRKDVLLWTDDHINLLQILKKSPLSR